MAATDEQRGYTPNSDTSIEIPYPLNRDVLVEEFGEEAVEHYETRLRERESRGKTYLNPLKTIYIWATEDRISSRGYYGFYLSNFNSSKLKNHGKS